jgi:uncharacterized protein (TIGR00369 family)
MGIVNPVKELNPAAKPVSASRVTISQLMQPGHANNQGNVHGGWIMKLMDEAGALACMRHAQNRVVTVAVDQLMFKEPIHTTDLVIITAEVSFVGRTSMEAEIQVVAENPISGESRHTNTAYYVYVALDESGNPVSVPQLIPENKAQANRMEQAKNRRLYRLNQQN